MCVFANAALWKLHDFLSRENSCILLLRGWGVPVARISRIKRSQFPRTLGCKPESRATEEATPPRPGLPQERLHFCKRLSPVYKNLAGAARLSASVARFSHSTTATLQREAAGGTSWTRGRPVPLCGLGCPLRVSSAFLQGVQGPVPVVSLAPWPQGRAEKRSGSGIEELG